MPLPLAPMWLVDLGIGIVVSPFEIKRGRRAVRPELGIYGNNLIRTNCDRCDTDAGLGQVKPAEPTQGFMWRLRAGLDFYLWNRASRWTCSCPSARWAMRPIRSRL